MAVTTLKDYPYKFDNTAIDFPLSWVETVTTVEDVQRNEAGTDIIIVSRYDKLSVSATARVTSAKLETYDTFSKKKSFTLTADYARKQLKDVF